jgi:predicted S18 family serine protease
MITALVSLLRDKPTRADVAMTGEITLRGLVMPVGGVKEKVLAAVRAGIKTVILPSRNEKDLQDLPPDAVKKMEFVFAERIEDVLAEALEGRRPRKTKTAAKSKAAAKPKRAATTKKKASASRRKPAAKQTAAKRSRKSKSKSGKAKPKASGRTTKARAKVKRKRKSRAG